MAPSSTNTTLADEALQFIGALYKVESDIQSQSIPHDEVVAYRQTHAKPLLERFHQWLLQNKDQVPPKRTLGRAMAYALKQWHGLEVYCDHPYLTPDNNAAENAIRPFVIGRKNWLFCDSVPGAKASASFYSLLITAQNNGINPFQYLKYLFEVIPDTKNSQIATLLPQNIDKNLFSNEQHNQQH